MRIYFGFVLLNSRLLKIMIPIILRKVERINQFPKGIVPPLYALTVTVITCDAELPASSLKVILLLIINNYLC